jgi:hypothetical protein
LWPGSSIEVHDLPGPQVRVVDEAPEGVAELPDDPPME